jgi:hypothetical protein
VHGVRDDDALLATRPPSRTFLDLRVDEHVPIAALRPPLADVVT